MNKLDEIEAKAGNTLYINPSLETFGLDSYLNGQDVNLLIRAVRQLGAVVSATEEFPLDLVRRKALDAVDPDVLALLEEGRSAE